MSMYPHEVGKSCQQMQPLGVLGKAPVPDLGIAEQYLAMEEQVFNLGTDACHELL